VRAHDDDGNRLTTPCEQDPETWTDISRKDSGQAAIIEAVRLCRSCPVLSRCEEYARSWPSWSSVVIAGRLVGQHNGAAHFNNGRVPLWVEKALAAGAEGTE